MGDIMSEDQNDSELNYLLLKNLEEKIGIMKNNL